MLQRVLILLFLTGLVAQAQPMVVEAQVVKASQAMKERRLSADQWTKMLRSGKIEILEETSHPTTATRDSLQFVGAKYPQVYSDPRAGGTQVQYTDVGFKIDVKPQLAADGTFIVDSRLEKSAINETHEPGGSEVALFYTSFPMKRGETVVALAVQGHMASDFVKYAYPAVKFGPNDSLILAVTVR